MRSMSPVRLGPVMNERKLGQLGAYRSPDQLVGRGEIGHELPAPRDDNVMRRQNGERAAPGTAATDHDAAGLGHQRVAAGDARVARFEIGDGVARIGDDRGQIQFRGEIEGEGGTVSGDPLPAIAARDGGELRGNLVKRGSFNEFSFQKSGVLREERDLFLNGRADRRKPFSKSIGGG